ncbi:Type IV secretory pathway, VirB4 component [Peptoniphilus asaccharolyticus DSM 20463]|uniref:Type IV secretory pathway, VirB4 component n=1 Tax=Peptoniphilus asaccharolyticus DSM 20463 TaxID=573058 RepID=A0A1W1UBT1_PEPAS|nr:DUF87 domain-containing protein [Peptoniphilus asaccharolyticus]MBL7576439.1 ATP-binding protein [Peptoniphilus asaccharolyticus]SMB78555.1 Type IV secretory pathway, VirB4 component [Peptoniphilus asaccharolyticus DSM 20463]
MGFSSILKGGEIKNSNKNKNQSKDKGYKNEISKSVQQTLPYVQAFEDGIFETRKGYYTKVVKFEDINYQIARQDMQENFFLDYCSFLNSMDSNLDYQITIMNTSIAQDELESDILIDTDKNDNFNEFREEYNGMLLRQIAEGRNDIRKEKYITFGCYANNKKDANATLNRVEQEISQNFKKLGSKVKSVTLKERLNIYHKFYRGTGKMSEDFRENAKFGLVTKDLIAPDSFEFKRDYMMIGDQYARALFLSDLGSFLSDRILTELTEFPFNMSLSINIKTFEPHKALRLINKQITGMEANKIDYQKRSIKNGYFDAFIPHELRDKLDEALNLRTDITNNNQKLITTSIIIVHKADTLEQLNIDTEEIASAARKNMCNIRKLNYQQEDGLAAALPFGNNRFYKTLQRTLTTESTAVFMPFTSQEVYQKNGMYYGLNTVSGNLIMLNRKNLKNDNGFILGTPGSGKSFSAKREMVNILLNTDDEVLIIDPEREYTKLVENFEGQVIKISAGSSHYINPLDMSEEYADDEDPLVLKADFILSLCEVIIGGRTGLNPTQKSIIDRCLKLIYQDYLQSGFDEEYLPTLKDFHKAVKKQPEFEAKDIATALELYALGSQGVFANKTNVDVNNRLVCYDIKDLGKNLKTMGMLIVLDAIWNRVTTNRDKGKRTWIYMDEIYLLFSNEYSAQFLYELFKRARKWGAIPTGITQNIEDLLKSDTARSMLANSEFIQLLNQAPLDRAELATILNLSDTQLSYVTNANSGEGLLVASSDCIPFTDKFPIDTKLYKMMTTKVEEI